MTANNIIPHNRSLETRRDLKRLMMEERRASSRCWSCIELKVKMLGIRATLSGATPRVLNSITTRVFKKLINTIDTVEAANEASIDA